MTITPQERESRKNRCVNEALRAGVVSGATALGISGPLVYLANRFYPGFRTGLGISGKTTLVVTPMFFMFFLDSYLTMGRCAQRVYYEALDEQEKQQHQRHLIDE